VAEETALPEPALHLDGGGPLHRLLTLARVERLRARIAAALALGWVPVVALAIVDRLATGRVDPLMRDLSVHVRLLVAVPLFLVAGAVLDVLADRVLRRLVDEGFVGDEQARFALLVRRTDRLRRARTPELLLAALSLCAGVGTLVGWMRPAGIIGGEAATALSASRVYYGVVALPLSLFLFARALWQWAIWTRLLGGLSRLALRLEPAHPDRRGGLAFLKRPSLAFMALWLTAVSCVLSAGWGTRILVEGVRVTQFTGELGAFLVLALSLAFGPLLLFTPRLYVAGVRGRRQLSALATEYARRFRERWLSREAPEEALLGTPDVQSLADLSTTYRETSERASALLFSRRDPGVLVVLLLVPMLPLALTEIPLDTLIRKVGELVLGVH